MYKPMLKLFLYSTITIGLSSSCVLAAEKVAMDSANLIIKNPKDNRQYDSFSLDNGIQVIVVSDPNGTYLRAIPLFIG